MSNRHILKLPNTHNLTMSFLIPHSTTSFPPSPPSNCSVLLSLKSSQIDVDAEDEDGWTALHAAVYWGNMDLAEELVMHGASVNKKTKLVRRQS